MKLAFRAHLANTLVKFVIVAALLAYAFHMGHVQGVQHAIATAIPTSEGDVYLIDFDGQVHEYR